MPPVVAAADAALGRNAELERRAAVRAVPVQQPDAPGAVAESDQVLAEQAHRYRQVFQLGGEHEGMPVAAQVLAAWRAGSDSGEQTVVVPRGTLEVAAVGSVGAHGVSPIDAARIGGLS